jgi:hypothetical protein
LRELNLPTKLVIHAYVSEDLADWVNAHKHVIDPLSIPKTPSATEPSQERLNADMIPFAGQTRPMLGDGME